jgi:tetratricopeptide (TPR) repeat protein
MVVLTLVLALAGLGAVRWIGRPTPPGTPLVEVRPLTVIGDDLGVRAFAARAADAIAAFLSDSEVRVVSPSSPIRPPNIQLAFGGTVSSADGGLRLHLVLNDLRSGTELWSGDYAEPAARADALIDEAKGGAIETINIIRPGYGRGGLVLDPETNLLGLRSGLETVMPTATSRRDAVHDIEQALARDPDSPLVRSAHAIDLAMAGVMAAPSDQADLFKQAQAEAQRTIREHPDQPGTSHLALLVVANTQAPRDWVGNLARVEAALKVSPEEPYLYGFACGAMRGVGRAVDGLHYCQRALALLPHTPTLLLNYAAALDMVGDRQTADALLDEGVRLYPHFDDIRTYRFDREAWNGSPDRALALLHDPNTAPTAPAPYLAAVELLEKARKSGLASDADAAMTAMREATRQDQIMPLRVLFPMALGRLDDAFRAPDLAAWEDDTGGGLMTSAMDRLRRDARFWPLAARAGLVRYWRTTNKWPDFCSNPTYPLNCRAEAERVTGPGPAAE